MLKKGCSSRFRTYFPDAYKIHYPNARTHLSSKVRSTLPDGTNLFEKTRSKRRRPFTVEEDRALKAGYEKHGTTWATIVKDPVFQEQNRRSTDLRDRFRNAFPELYKAAGYKPRTNVKKKMVDSDSISGIKHAATDDQLGTSSSGLVSTAGPVRSRRRAQTSQGLLRGGTKSMPQSTVASEDEESSAGEEDLGRMKYRARQFKATQLPTFTGDTSISILSAPRLKKQDTETSLSSDATAGEDDITIEVDDTSNNASPSSNDYDDSMDDGTLERLAIPDFLPSAAQQKLDDGTVWPSGVDTPTHSSVHAWSTTAGSPTSDLDYFMTNSTQSSPFMSRPSDDVGTQSWDSNWFSPTSRPDANSVPSSSASSSSFLNGGTFSPTSPFSTTSFQALNQQASASSQLPLGEAFTQHQQGVLDRYGLVPSHLDLSTDLGLHDFHQSGFPHPPYTGHGFHSHNGAYTNPNGTPFSLGPLNLPQSNSHLASSMSSAGSAFSDDGDSSSSVYNNGLHSQIAGDLISGNRSTHQWSFSSLYGFNPPVKGPVGTSGLGLFGLTDVHGSSAVEPLSVAEGGLNSSVVGRPQGHTARSSISGLGDLGLTSITLEDPLEIRLSVEEPSVRVASESMASLTAAAPSPMAVDETPSDHQEHQTPGEDIRQRHQRQKTPSQSPSRTGSIRRSLSRTHSRNGRHLQPPHATQTRSTTEPLQLSDLIVTEDGPDASSAIYDGDDDPHSTPPATPIFSRSRPVRRSSGSMLQFGYDSTATGGHTRSISVPPSEARIPLTDTFPDLSNTGENVWMGVDMNAMGMRLGAMTPPASLGYNSSGSGAIGGGYFSNAPGRTFDESLAALRAEQEKRQSQAVALGQGHGRQQTHGQPLQQPATVYPGSLMLATSNSASTPAAIHPRPQSGSDGSLLDPAGLRQPTTPTTPSAPSGRQSATLSASFRSSTSASHHSMTSYPTTPTSFTYSDLSGVPYLDMHYWNQNTMQQSQTSGTNSAQSTQLQTLNTLMGLPGVGDEFWAHIDGIRQGQALDLASSTGLGMSTNSAAFAAGFASATSPAALTSLSGFGGVTFRGSDPYATVRGSRSQRKGRADGTSSMGAMTGNGVPSMSPTTPQPQRQGGQESYTSSAPPASLAMPIQGSTSGSILDDITLSFDSRGTHGQKSAGLGRSMSHHRGQSAVCPQDLMLDGDTRRKRASWDGGVA